MKGDDLVDKVHCAEAGPKLVAYYDDVLMKMNVKVFMVYLWLLSDAKHSLLVLTFLT